VPVSYVFAVIMWWRKLFQSVGGYA